MPYAFQPQTCRFFLYGSFTEIINDQLQNLPFDPLNGIRLSFQCIGTGCRQSLDMEIDPSGNIAKVTAIDPRTRSAEMTFDFVNGQFIHYEDSLDLICGHPLFHMLQQTFAAHYQNGGYSVTVTAL